MNVHTYICVHRSAESTDKCVLLSFAQFNMSHTIHRLSFGHDFPGREDPLDGHAEFVEDGEGLPREAISSARVNAFNI